MKSSVALLIFVALLCAQPKWKLIWQDEFSLPGIPDPTKWEFDTEGNEWDWGNNELQNYTLSSGKNAWVENGRLIIEARKQENTALEDHETRAYSSARLRTMGHGDWIYGKFEIRAKVPKGVGTWPAIWMLPTDNSYGDWPHSGELDIMEAIGSESTTHYSTVWCSRTEATDGKGGKLTITNQNSAFHTYVMEWYPDSICFFADTKLVTTYYNEHTDESQWPFNERFHLLLNLAVGGDWETNVEDSSFPARFEIDYVRVYQSTVPPAE